MNELIETIKANLNNWGELIEAVLNSFSLLFIILGLILAFVRSVQHIQQRNNFPGNHPLHSFFRMVFGGWLVVALEFQLAADIVGTIISPTTKHLIELGAIAMIRTFLNYFLSKELVEERESTRTTIERKETKVQTPVKQFTD
jgi:uncharacterized membrane protein